VYQSAKMGLLKFLKRIHQYLVLPILAQSIFLMMESQSANFQGQKLNRIANP